MSGKAVRKNLVRQKLNPMPFVFIDKTEEIIEMAYEARAKKVYIASSAPAVRYPNVYRIDIYAVAELIAHDRNVDDICPMIGANRLIF